MGLHCKIVVFPDHTALLHERTQEISSGERGEAACPLHFEIGSTCTLFFSNWGYKPIFGGTHLRFNDYTCANQNQLRRMKWSFLLAFSPCWPALMTSWRVHYDFLCILVHSGLFGLQCVFLFDLLWCSCIFFNLILSAIPRFVRFSL